MNHKLRRILSKTGIVGVIASRSDLQIALHHPDRADFFEWRVDCVPGDDVGNLLQRMGKPIILTVRDVKEGGKQSSWTVEERADLYERYMPIASLIDIEASTVGFLPKSVLLAKKLNVGIILSHHNFNTVSSFDRINAGINILQDIGGDIYKIAVTPEGLDQLSRFISCIIQLQDLFRRIRIVAMAMGKFGKISRLAFCLDGAPLVYGCLGEANVRGQWNVSEFREILARMA